MFPEIIDRLISCGIIFCKHFAVYSGDTVGVQARGLRVLQAPPDSGKTIIFRAKGKFFGQKPAAKKKFFLMIFIKRENGIHSV